MLALIWHLPYSSSWSSHWHSVTWTSTQYKTGELVLKGVGKSLQKKYRVGQSLLCAQSTCFLILELTTQTWTLLSMTQYSCHSWVAIGPAYASHPIHFKTYPQTCSPITCSRGNHLSNISSLFLVEFSLWSQPSCCGDLWSQNPSHILQVKELVVPRSGVDLWNKGCTGLSS
jgi:hypothetical protein